MDLDDLAAAICNGYFAQEDAWERAVAYGTDKRWFRAAQAAVDALQLTEERDWFPASPTHLPGCGDVQKRRLVGPWVRCQEDGDD